MSNEMVKVEIEVGADLLDKLLRRARAEGMELNVFADWLLAKANDSILQEAKECGRQVGDVLRERVRPWIKECPAG
ncbi:hypothetical protein P4C99_07645 [Pontiellaceae bacterium B1224]|nr:hypothetical protein [Pontiellaceae bacterium B1224]